MNRIKTTFLIAILSGCLSACSGKPQGMDDNTYQLGVKALEVMDAYNSAEITEDEAKEKLEGIYDRLHGRNFAEDESTQDIQNSAVAVCVLDYQITMSSKGDLVESADNLRKKLNKKKK